MTAKNKYKYFSLRALILIEQVVGYSLLGLGWFLFFFIVVKYLKNPADEPGAILGDVLLPLADKPVTQAEFLTVVLIGFGLMLSAVAINAFAQMKKVFIDIERAVSELNAKSNASGQ